MDNKIIAIDIEAVDRVFNETTRLPENYVRDIYKITIAPILKIEFAIALSTHRHFEIYIPKKLKPLTNPYNGPLYELTGDIMVTQYLWDYINSKFLKLKRVNDPNAHEAWAVLGFAIATTPTFDDWEADLTGLTIKCTNEGETIRLMKKYNNLKTTTTHNTNFTF